MRTIVLAAAALLVGFASAHAQKEGVAVITNPSTEAATAKPYPLPTDPWHDKESWGKTGLACEALGLGDFELITATGDDAKSLGKRDEKGKYILLITKETQEPYRRLSDLNLVAACAKLRTSQEAHNFAEEKEARSKQSYYPQYQRGYAGNPQSQHQLEGGWIVRPQPYRPY
jgi:hypothetical protein